MSYDCCRTIFNVKSKAVSKDVCKYKSHKLITFGGHSHSHLTLGYLDRTTLKKEIVTAKKNVDDLIKKAKLKGYEGDACSECGNFTLVRNGTCLKCDTCGATTGCS